MPTSVFSLSYMVQDISTGIVDAYEKLLIVQPSPQLCHQAVKGFTLSPENPESKLQGCDHQVASFSSLFVFFFVDCTEPLQIVGEKLSSVMFTRNSCVSCFLCGKHHSTTWGWFGGTDSCTCTFPCSGLVILSTCSFLNVAPSKKGGCKTSPSLLLHKNNANIMKIYNISIYYIYT